MCARRRRVWQPRVRHAKTPYRLVHRSHPASPTLELGICRPAPAGSQSSVWGRRRARMRAYVAGRRGAWLCPSVILTTSRNKYARVSARFHPLHLSAARAAESPGPLRALRWRSSRPSCSGSRRSSSQPSRSAARSSSRTTRGSLRRSRRTRRTCSTRRARAAPGGEAGGRGGEGVTCMRPCLRAASALAFSSQEPFARVPTLPAQARASWPPEGHGCSDGPFASPARAAQRVHANHLRPLLLAGGAGREGEHRQRRRGR